MLTLLIAYTFLPRLHTCSTKITQNSRQSNECFSVNPKATNAIDVRQFRNMREVTRKQRYANEQWRYGQLKARGIHFSLLPSRDKGYWWQLKTVCIFSQQLHSANWNNHNWQQAHTKDKRKTLRDLVADNKVSQNLKLQRHQNIFDRVNPEHFIHNRWDKKKCSWKLFNSFSIKVAVHIRPKNLFYIM